MRRLISTNSPFELEAGYSRAVVEGDWCFISGTTGYDYKTMRLPASLEAQVENALNTIEQTLAEAGFSLSDIVRVVYYATERENAPVIFAAVGKRFKTIRPAATMIICGLIKPEMKIEIEATALRKGAPSPT